MHTRTHACTHARMHAHTQHTSYIQSTFTGGGTFSTTFFVGVTVVALATGCLTSSSLWSTDTTDPLTDDDDNDDVAGVCTGEDSAGDCCNLFNRFSLTSSASSMTDENSGNKYIKGTIYSTKSLVH